MSRSLAYFLASVTDALENSKRSGNAEWERKWYERLEQLHGLLPSGSGIDAGYTSIEVDQRRIRVQFSFHVMDDNGFYAGWQDYRVTVTPTFYDSAHVFVYGRDNNGMRDYLAELFHHALTVDKYEWDEAAGRYVRDPG